MVLSPIKWVGGKRWAVDLIKPYYLASGKSRIVEPFCGGCSITLGLLPETALLNDLNYPLITFWQQVQKGESFTYDLTMSVSPATVYKIYRDNFNCLKKKTKGINHMFSYSLARLFYYLNKMAFNGIYRENKKGEFNVGWNKKESIKDLDFDANIIKGYAFTCGDYININLNPHTDFVFVDPPYHDGFSSYSKEGFDLIDHNNLINWLVKSNCDFVLMNKATPEMIELYKRYPVELRVVDAPRKVSCNGDRAPVKELIVSNINLINNI